MSLFDENLPRPAPKVHEIGSDLSLLSVADLQTRIGTLKSEIARLEAEIVAKQASRGAAESLFKQK